MKSGATDSAAGLILGIDPGTAITGYAVLDVSGRTRVVDSGYIGTSLKDSVVVRLHRIYRGVQELIARHHPAEVAVEQVFFNRNAKTALAVGQARGVILLACADTPGDVFEYTPLEVKQAVCSYGRATKRQIQYMVMRLLTLEEVPQPDDVADAMAVALCHYCHRRHKALEASLSTRAAT